MLKTPKLLHQGLILILVPLVFEIGFIVILIGFVEEVENNLAAEKHSVKLMSHGHNILQAFLPLGKALYTFRQSDDERSLNAYRTKVAQIQSELATMNALVNDHCDEDERHAFTKLQLSCRQMLHEFDVLTQAMVRRDTYTGYGGKQRQESLRRMIDEIDAFIRKEKERGQKLRAQTEASRQTVKNTLLTGWVLNAIMAAALVAYFTSRTTDRLKIVSNNSIRFGQGQPLLPLLGGDDEIGRLDTVFHDMARDLKAAEQRKKELVQMVSHDLRTPLASIKISMETLKAGVFGDLPETAVTAVNKCMLDADHLINLSNQLLEGERREATRSESSDSVE